MHRLPPPRILIQCADYPTLLNLVAETDLLCVVPHPALQPQESVRDAFAVVRIREGLPLYEVCLFWSFSKQPRSAKVIDSIVDRLKTSNSRQ